MRGRNVRRPTGEGRSISVAAAKEACERHLAAPLALRVTPVVKAAGEVGAGTMAAARATDAACVIDRASARDAKEVFRLRVAAYSHAAEFELTRPELLRWGPHDDAAVVLAARGGGRMLSTLRGVVVADRGAAEAELTCTVSFGPEAFPALVLGKGATLRGYGRSGLHSALRFHFLAAALEGRVNSVLGLVYASAPRTNLMRQLGYEFHVPARLWDPEGVPIQPGLLAHLSRRRLASAHERLASEVADVLAAYPWHGDALRLDS